MTLKKLLFAVLVLSLTLASCKVKKQDFADITLPAVETVKYTTVPDLTEKDIHWHISVLASDSMYGRMSATSYEALAAGYIKEKFESLGLKAFDDNFFQPVPITSRKYFRNCELYFEDYKGEYPADFRPMIMFDSLTVVSDVVFAGYGNDSDYENLNVKGKWVMILEGSNSIMYEKKTTAKTNGALGVLAIGKDGTTGDQRYVLGVDSVPLIKISQNLSDNLLAHAGTTVSEVLEKVATGENPIFPIPVTINATVKSESQQIVSQNVVAYLGSSDSGYKDEYILIGGHYDHLGIKTVDDSMQVFNGADDNASGVAGVLEIAEKLCAEKKLKYNIIFAAFGAEELGLIGSRYFCNNPPVPLENIKLMVNLDMIGRMNSSNQIYTSTVEANDKFNNVLVEIKNLHPDINVSSSSDNRFRGSDHTSFINKHIPAISFTTGLHDAYHTPADTIGSINCRGEKLLLDFIYDFVISPATDNCIRSRTSSDVNP
jgi:hypothetical protein